MEQYTVTGMSCAACSARVEKAVKGVPGVTDCAVSLLTNSMQVEGNADGKEIIRAVEKAGYKAAPADAGKKEQEEAGGGTTAVSAEISKIKIRLWSSVILLLPLMYVSMGSMMWGWPLPSRFADNPMAIGIYELLLSGFIMIINQKFFLSGFKGVIHRAPNMDTLVALGAGASYVYSVSALFAMSDAYVRGEAEHAGHYVHDFYFESAAMILTLITVGKLLEAYSKGKTTNALKGLINLAPETAQRLRNGKEETVAVKQVQVGDILVVRPGEAIPVDACVLEGNGAVNEAALTGESLPTDKEAGDDVHAGTMNLTGVLTVKATGVGEDTALSRIIQLVKEASATKAPIAKIADKVSGIFVPTVIAVALVTVIVWLLVGKDFGFALSRGIAVLVISCPCALGLATPVAIMVGNGVGAKNGILFKTAVSLEQTGKARIVVFDKTGTVTNGKPMVTDVIAGDGTREEDFLQLVYSLEYGSEHPLAKAICEYMADRGIERKEVSDFKAVVGNGLIAFVDGKKLFGGNERFVSLDMELSKDMIQKSEELAAKGKTPLFFGCDGRYLGMLAVMDTPKEDAAKALAELRGMGMRVVMLTGDHEKTAKAVAKQLGIEEVVAQVLPDEKEKVITQLRKVGSVIMVGDGINDAPALTSADVGIALGAGTDIAIDAAEVVLMKKNLADVPAAIRLSRATLRTIHENLFWAFIYNIIGIPLAAGLFIELFGWKLNPMFGAAAMSLSSFCVVSNALRLNLAGIYHKQKEKEINKMEKTMEIKGMMCGHCEARVKKCLEALEQVSEAVVSHENGTAIVKLNAELSDEVLKSTVEAQDYEVVSIQ